MNSAEMIARLPGFFEEYLGGTTPQWILPPAAGLNVGAWRFRLAEIPEAPIAVKVLGNDSDEIRINVGLVLNLTFTSQLAEYVNMLNYKQLIHGRMFILGGVPFVGSGEGPCAVVMQEIFFGRNLSFESVPAMNGLLAVTGRLAGQGGQFVASIVNQFGGLPFGDDDESDGVLLVP